MDAERIEHLLEAVAAGRTSVAEAREALRGFPYDDTLPFARLDTQRGLRTGRPEVVFCQGKTPAQCAAIAERLAAGSDVVLLTRADAAVAEAVLRALPHTAVYHDAARCLTVGTPPVPRPEEGTIAVVTAGTADIPVAEEACVTLATLGSAVERFYDVGVAGLHRLIDCRARLDAARAVVVVAGMEGALASVVGGLVSRPVVACPTSVGYGASFGGVSALLTMLNSCATGVAVVNIDNGFGAACFAHVCSRPAPSQGSRGQEK